MKGKSKGCPCAAGWRASRRSRITQRAEERSPSVDGSAEAGLYSLNGETVACLVKQPEIMYNV
ncbi:hypothetical protein BJY59DRAFT_685335 [Rhodotorula toruloides]